MYRRWETETRYYTATIGVDLLGDLVMIKSWGGLRNGRGGEAIAMLPDQPTAAAQLAALGRRRSKRGYHLFVGLSP